MDKYRLGIPSNEIYVSETLHALQARLIDPNIMTYMDEYAILLKFKSDNTRLNKLVHDMLHIDPARAETCVALAAFWERKDERKALTYAEKVIPFYRYGLWKLTFHLIIVTLFYILQSLRVDDRHITGYIMKVLPHSIVHTT
jgi:anaphase-promoting complex subunit 7